MNEYVIEITSKISCFVLVLFQGILLNAYLAKIHGSSWWGWIAADAIIILIWGTSLSLVHKGFIVTKDRLATRGHIKHKEHEQSPDEVKYVYMAWLVYAVFLCPRVLLIFLNLNAELIHGKELLGANLLNVGVGCTPLIYLSLVHGFHNAEPLTSRKLFIQHIAASGALDLFDSMDLLELLFEEQHGFSTGYVTAIAFFASVNWFLPTLGLLGIRIQTISGRVASKTFKLFNVLSVLLILNVPNLVIRVVLWNKYNAHVSVLIMKNVMWIFLGLYEIAEYFGESSPTRCDQCGDWYDVSAFAKHRQVCLDHAHVHNVTDRQACLEHEISDSKL